MAYKVFTSDELAQKFLDNAQSHIISDSFKSRLTLSNIKNAIRNGWGFDVSESNKCVCCDHESMDEYGEWGTSSGQVNMRTFWLQVFGASNFMSITNPSLHTVNSQITIPEDNKLLSEENVNIKGCCAKIDEALSERTITVANTGVTSDTEIRINFNPVIRNTITGMTPSLIVVTKATNTLYDVTSPVIGYFDVDADDTTDIKWNVNVTLTGSTGTILNYPDNSYLKFNDITYDASFYTSGTTSNGITASFRTVIENKSINDIANINNIGFSTWLVTTADTTSVLDISNCKITTYPTWLALNTATYKSGNTTVQCRFGASPVLAWNSTVTISAQFKYQSSGTMQLVFYNNDLGPINGSTVDWWMWVGLPAYADSRNTVVATVYLCFKVIRGDSTLALGDNVCYLNVASPNTLTIQVSGFGNVLVKNETSNYTYQLMTNGSSYSGTFYTYEGSDLILNSLQLISSTSGNRFSTVCWGRVTDMGAIQQSSYTYTTINIIPNEVISSFADLVNTLYNQDIGFRISQ